MSETIREPDIYTELADGTILNASCGFDGESSIWIWMRDRDDPNNSMAAMFAIFTDLAKTEVITSHIREVVETFEGYTELTGLQLDGSGFVSVQMKKG